MQLNERLEICLLALASRYPDHVVDINEAVLGHQQPGAQGWTAHDLIEELHTTQSTLLNAQAHLIIDTQMSEIYLPDYSEQTPAIFVHCRGKIPTPKRELQAQRTGGRYRPRPILNLAVDCSKAAYA